MADLQIMKQADPPFGSVVALDVDGLGVGDPSLEVSYTHATKFEFTCQVPMHTLPLVYTDFVIVWDAEGTVDGAAQSQSNPLFEGFVEEITPGSHGNEVKVTCYDPTYRVTREVPVMNAPWQLDGSNEPVEGDAAYPRAVFNCTNDNDDDYAYAILLRAKLGQIIAQVLQDAYLPLYHLNAAPGNGTPAGGGQAYLDAELGSANGSGFATGLEYEPQEKIVSQSEPVRSFIERFLQAYEPTVKFYWQPGERLWRFYTMPDLPAINIEVNNLSATYGRVLSLDVQRSAEGRYTAIKFYGPETVIWKEATWYETPPTGVSNTLVPVGAYAFGTGTDTGTCYWQFQIVDPTFTRMARKGPYAVYVPGPFAIWANSDGSIVQEVVQTWVQSWIPTLQAKWPNTYGGDANFKTINGALFDFRSGTVSIGNACLFRFNIQGVASRLESPTEVKVVYPMFDDPLTVRYPSSGFSGTAFSVGGLEIEQKEYDEMLAVGYEFGIPVTTPTRLARFTTLAEHLHRQRKDLVYAGGVVLEGLQYEFARLGKRVNLTAKKDDGTVHTTGWEGIGAWVTDVSYDFEQNTTTLTFSSDHLELMAVDPVYLKAKLKIRAAQKRYWLNYRTLFSYYRAHIPGYGSFWNQRWGVEVVIESGWFDEFGEQQ